MLCGLWISIDDAILACASSVAAVQSGAPLLSTNKMTPHSREKAAARCPRVSAGVVETRDCRVARYYDHMPVCSQQWSHHRRGRDQVSHVSRHGWGPGGGQDHLGQPHPVLLHHTGLLRGARQHMEVPLPLPAEWGRWAT